MTGKPSLVPLAIPNLLGREADYLQACISSTFVSSVGPFVTRFEDSLARLSGAEATTVVCSGTVALQMALTGLGIGAGDLVMIPSLTFIATANAVSHAGAAPWLVDCDAAGWTMDLDRCRHLIETETEPAPGGRRHRTSGQVLKALMPVMIMGATLDFAATVALAREYGLKVVVDAAAAIGAAGPDDTPLAATGVDAVCYSFNGNKTVTCGGGGAIAGNKGLIDRIRHLCSTARVGRDYDHDEIGYNFRMTNVQAALGVAQLERLDDFLAAKLRIRNAYADFAGGYQSLHPFPEPPTGRSVHWFSGFWYSGPDATLPSRFREHMQSAAIDLRPFWKPIHLQAPYRTALASPMPVVDDLWTRIFPLPCSTHLTDGDLDRVLTAAREFWNVHD
ncbi:dTDP-4-amino-4,6-dideoxygalactose transaminase [Rhodovulum imhoffii]|uniref:dTDP-4-amino-4,6-dideoxygalactose transaminase n=1 Tax=Rhodovulum imhoffii TaxID=365340 RepID=A0A2T5BTY2_9RHOB|nr:aminotransferase class I/II-fold pyridoxal phosphate-dependent enzyme [Rhodovulum imhoffii]MBK5932724.1 hypothetical protein [Rhodovulum imhoffii]PTN02930.1 dTDP-4-amino-4,6-dideoxygalactose transaminase [Rhodovulum imhoffii]